jgi:hypothetical protein
MLVRICEYRGYPMFACDLQILGCHEALVPDLESVAQGDSIHLPGQHAEEGVDFRGVERLARRQLPEERTELCLQLRQATVDEARQAFSRGAQVAAVDDKAGRLEREHKVIGRFVAPLREHCRRLQSIERAVDFDRGDLPAGVVQLLILGNVFRVKRLAPGLVVPAAHAGANAARNRRLTHRLFLADAAAMIAPTLSGARNSAGDTVPAFIRAKPSIAC